MKPSQTILAVDPGIANTGYALRTHRNHIAWGTIETKSESSLTSRLIHIAERLSRLQPDILVIEDFYGNFSKPTVYLIGAIICMVRAHQTLVVSPAKWVTELFGRGKAGKYKVAAMMLGRKVGKPETQHEADALSLLEWYRKCYKHA